VTRLGLSRRRFQVRLPGAGNKIRERYQEQESDDFLQHLVEFKVPLRRGRL